ncbi:MAG: LptF/LptG family permease [Sphingobacteriales bacterium]
MFKKLDKLIVKAFLGPFVATFFITLFVLVMQFFWKYIDDLVGKGLDFISIVQLTGYVSATMITLALPLSVLISSIMTFGNLGETFELVAIKSAGIPLLRFMRPLIIISAFISITSFLLSNYVIPVANLKFYTMLYDIRVAKPAFDLKAGIFYNKLPNYAIKVGKKEKDGNGIYDVIIYENDYRMQDNIIVAEKGSMNMSSDKKFLEFHLQNGWRYQERGTYNNTSTEFIRIKFKEYKKLFDLSSFEMMKTPDSAFKNQGIMLNIAQLKTFEDSVNKIMNINIPIRFNKEIIPYLSGAKLIDSGWKNIPVKISEKSKSYLQLIPDSAIQITTNRLSEKINMIKSSNDLIFEDYKQKKDFWQSYRIEWHKKFSLAFACLVLFMIGAPLGSIIRKGGLGMPLVVAVIFFLLFHLLNMFGQKLADSHTLSAFSGMWLSSFVLVPIGAFLTYKAMRDSQLFNQEYYFRLFKQIKKALQRSAA